MATHTSILVWKNPWTEDPGGLQSLGLWRVRHDWTCTLLISSRPTVLWHHLPAFCPLHRQLLPGECQTPLCPWPGTLLPLYVHLFIYLGFYQVSCSEVFPDQLTLNSIPSTPVIFSHSFFFSFFPSPHHHNHIFTCLAFAFQHQTWAPWEEGLCFCFLWYLQQLEQLLLHDRSSIKLC